MPTEREILVYADMAGLGQLAKMGTLFSQRLKGKEIFSFSYDENWLDSGHALQLDPDLSFFKGKQFLSDEKPNFGLFLDSSPDRWGRLLMRRREAALARRDGRKEQSLYETDYLLGVYDAHRMGGLRFRLSNDGPFLNDLKELATPPWTSLRELEQASMHLENEDDLDDALYFKWLMMLVAPGSSLGGARPKASVLDSSGQLWIAKFPSRTDICDTGKWEHIVNLLAKESGIWVPEALTLKLNSANHTYLSKRFDRTAKLKRIHFASAMTLLGHNDGDDHSLGVSYLDIAEFIQQHCTNPEENLEQLWKRIAFNVLVSNTDDHLRNHGFILNANGWTLSPAYDMNPNENGTGLKLNISENDNSLEQDLVLEVATFFDIEDNKATKIMDNIAAVVSGWDDLAKRMGMSNTARALMKPAFRV